MLKRIFIALLIIFIIIQFFRPEKNIASAASPNDISNVHALPDSVHEILKVACYDCHSNNTRYPWYNNIQPVAWWLRSHITDGKKGLNFSEFASYNAQKQYKKFTQIIKEVKSGGMPLSSYTLIHRDAVLSDHQKGLITGWASIIADSLKAVDPSIK